MFELLSRTIDRKRPTWSKEKLASNQRIFSEWERVVINEYGPKMVTLAKPYLFKQQRLIVTVRNTIVACEIKAKKEKNRNIINKSIGEKVTIKEIVIKIS